MRKTAFVAAVLTVATAKAASADISEAINAPPSGPGTEVKSTLAPVQGRVVPGWEIAGQVGGGVGFGLGGRLGYTFDRGVYLGGSFTHFWGSTVDTVNGDQRTSQNLYGGDVGYRMFFFSRSFEVRPFVFLGANSRHINHSESRTVSSETDFAVNPSLLAAYHIGPAFISGEVRLLLTPTPVKVAGFGGLGFAL